MDSLTFVLSFYKCLWIVQYIAGVFDRLWDAFTPQIKMQFLIQDAHLLVKERETLRKRGIHGHMIMT